MSAKSQESPEFVAAADLLWHRMSTLGLAPSAVAQAEPQLFCNLQSCCVRCDSRDRCTFDVSRADADRSWINYCKNAKLLCSLAEVWSLRELL